ncbi:unnamed protein product [Lactuca virosa]|uniref:Uncharacterized protein n=1 Tax=Lactuca virosa TaxID=75947 RepID=A0AAU9N830_9ASTR|nr:unnamed protein product [Lactuca virosa]
MDVRKQKAKRNETPNMKLQLYPCSLGDPTFFLDLANALDTTGFQTAFHVETSGSMLGECVGHLVANCLVNSWANRGFIRGVKSL